MALRISTISGRLVFSIGLGRRPNGGRRSGSLYHEDIKDPTRRSYRCAVSLLAWHVLWIRTIRVFSWRTVEEQKNHVHDRTPIPPTAIADIVVPANRDSHSREQRSEIKDE